MIAGTRRLYPRTGRIAAAAAIMLGAATMTHASSQRPMLRIPNAQIEPVAWSAVEGWTEDNHAEAFAAYFKSCEVILRGTKAMRDARPVYGALYEACRAAADNKPKDAAEARAFFEANFQPVRIAPLGEPAGFVTGYYEPIVNGSRQENDEFAYPLYRKPPNLLPGGRMLAKAAVVASSSAKGKGKNKRRVAKHRLVPFHDRASIDDGVIAGRNLEICWLRDPIDAFFVHIQGSVRVRLDDGKMLRLNYLAQNGHPYYAVGRYLIDRKIVSKEEMSMDRIRQWMEANPAEGRELRRRNKSYVFFRETNLAENEEAIGAQGISLTAWRSIAVDRNVHVYGTPFFIAAELPIESEQPTTKFRRLMVAQDTGGAIIGPARADIYFGAGEEAGRISGRLRHSGRFVMLVPNGINPGGKDVPLPQPKPPALVALQKPATGAGKVAATAATGQDDKSAAKAVDKPSEAAVKQAAAKPDKPAAARSAKASKSRKTPLTARARHKHRQ
jgi:membrane-bound lytic murein transglycosylase A